jgi:hypothetical protein
LDVQYASHKYVASVLSGCCICFAIAFQCFQVFLQVFHTHVSSVSSIYIRMLQMFYLDVSKVERVLHMLQWRKWPTDGGLPQGFGSYLSSLPSRRLASALMLGWWSSRVLCSDTGAGVGCDTGACVGAASRR